LISVKEWRPCCSAAAGRYWFFPHGHASPLPLARAPGMAPVANSLAPKLAFLGASIMVTALELGN
jgi:hypothetical protein